MIINRSILSENEWIVQGNQSIVPESISSNKEGGSMIDEVEKSKVLIICQK